MVRRTSKAAVKSLEKSKTESPTLRRSRRRRKSTSSDDSDHENSTKKNESPSSINRDSLRRSRRIIGNDSDALEKSVDCGSLATEELHQIGEGENLKGKSNDKKKSNNDRNESNVDEEIENKNVQVTSQSPSNTQTVLQNVLDKSKCEGECTKSDNDSCENKSLKKVYDDQELKAGVAVTVVSNESNPENVLKLEESAILKEDKIETQWTEDNIELKPLQPSENDFKSISDKSNFNETNPANSNDSSDKIVSSFRDSKEDIMLKVSKHSSECPKIENSDKEELLSTSKDQSEAVEECSKKMEHIETKKILLKRPLDGKSIKINKDQNFKEELNSSSVEVERCLDNHKLLESQKLENIEIGSSEQHDDSLKKKITLKRLPDTQTLGNLVDESDSKTEEQEVQWGSMYEKSENTKEVPTQKREKVDTNDKIEDINDKNLNRKILLKRRATVDDGKLFIVIDKKKKEDEIKLEQTSSFQKFGDKEQSSSGDDTTNEERKRKYSNAFQMMLGEHEEKEKLPKAINIVRNLLTQQSHTFDGREDPVIVKKFKWGSSDITSTRLNTLNFRDLRRMCPKLDLVKEDEVNLDLTFKEKQQLDIEKHKEMVEAKREEKEKMLMEHVEKEISEVEVKENVITLNRKISIVDDTASKMKPPPSPPKNPMSNVIFVTNLVRPFTVKQLKELLERTGTITEDGFWTDKIKSKCYVKYETPEEAEATRNALHGVNWPIGNGKKLIIEYSTEAEMDKVKNPPPIVRREKTPEKENQLPRAPIVKQRIEEKAEVIAPISTWDIGKEDNHQKHSRLRSRSKERVGKLSRLSYTPEDFYQKKTKYEELVVPKAMDDLFLKTKATPSIYWQPLSPEEIVLKQQQRLMRMEEHKRRLEESGRGRGGGARDLPRERERNFRRR